VGVPGRIGGLVGGDGPGHDEAARTTPSGSEVRIVTRLSLVHRHDPYWDVDGVGARRQRVRQRIVRFAIWVLILAVVAVASLNLPAIDPDFVVHGGGRVYMAGGLLGLLGAAALLALARVRRSSHD
jgi:hypothetical protein